MSDGVVWFRCFPSDYLRDTKRLTLEQHGAYWLLMLDCYSNGPLPDDDETLARIASPKKPGRFMPSNGSRYLREEKEPPRWRRFGLLLRK